MTEFGTKLGRAAGMYEEGGRVELSHGCNSEVAIEDTLPRDCIRALTDSPIFALTSAAKETSQTNFLAFLLQTTHVGLAPVRDALRQCFKIDAVCAKSGAEVYVWREKYNFDLLIVVITDREPESRRNFKVRRRNAEVAVLIEAKLKSVPSRQQIESYTKKTQKKLVLDLPHNHFLGLPPSADRHSPAKVEIFPNNIRHVLLANSSEPDQYPGWELIGWTDVIAALDQGMADLGGTAADRFRYLLEDYRNNLQFMFQLVEEERKFVETSQKSWGTILQRWDKYKEYWSSCIGGGGVLRAMKLLQKLVEKGAVTGLTG